MPVHLRCVMLTLMMCVVGCSRGSVPSQVGTPDGGVAVADANAQNNSAPKPSVDPLPEAQPAPPLQFEPLAAPQAPAASQTPTLPPPSSSSFEFNPAPPPAPPLAPELPSLPANSGFDPSPSPTLPLPDLSAPAAGVEPTLPALPAPSLDPLMPKATAPAPTAEAEPAPRPDAAPDFVPAPPLDLTPKAPEDAPAPDTNVAPQGLPPTTPPTAAREWSDRSGFHRLTASYVGYQNGWVRLAKPEGGTMVIQWANLSELDQGYVTARVESQELRSPRTWTDRSGFHRVTGRFLELKDGHVRLEKEDGGTVRVQLSQLSNFDQGCVTAAAQ
jgi:hypothetical protein